jgi:hypothetical protein
VISLCIGSFASNNKIIMLIFEPLQHWDEQTHGNIDARE